MSSFDIWFAVYMAIALIVWLAAVRFVPPSEAPIVVLSWFALLWPFSLFALAWVLGWFRLFDLAERALTPLADAIRNFGRKS